MKSALKTHGGKFYLAPKIIAAMPPHKRYLEAYSGGLNVLINKPYEGISEWANDLNGELTNFWNVLRDTPDQLLRALLATPVSQAEFMAAFGVTGTTDAQKRAYQFFVRNRMSRQGLGKDYITPTTRQRRGMNEHVSAYWGAIEGLPELHERLRRVEIWNLPAIEAIKRLDGKDFFTYLDPPYLPETRSSKGEYGEFEMTPEQHEELLKFLCTIKGKFLLSGYPSPLYEAFASCEGWNCQRILIPNNASSRKVKETKIECLWSNY